MKDLYKPSVYGVGFIGEGPYKAKVNGEHTKEYIAWRDMLKRCCSDNYHKKYPTYIGCEVCDEWLNFQNFAEWYDENHYEVSGERMALDKDILIKGNKIYSPDTCVFVPQSINLLFIKSNSKRGDLPIGVTYNKQYKKYQSQCSVNKKQKHLGYYDTPEEAFQIYKQSKEACIKKAANDYAELIPFNLYQAMIDYEVEYDD